MIEQECSEIEKREYKIAAFTVWQQTKCDKSFGQYLQLLGLAEKEPPMTRKHKDALIRKGLNNADKIIDRFRKADR